MATPSEQYQLMQELARLAGVDLAALWELALLEDDPFAFVLDLYPEIAAQYATIAAEMSAVWYEEQAPELDFTATPAALPALAVYRENAAWALGSGLGLEDREAALAKLTGALQKGVWDADRETMTQNAEAEGGARWVREAGPSSCPFCKMLATRSLSANPTYYSSREAAGSVVGRGKEMTVSDRRARARGETRSSGRFLAGGRRTRRPEGRALGKSYHDNCDCRVVAVRPGREYNPPEHVLQFEQEYIDASRAAPGAGAGNVKDIMAAWRQLETQ
ncbi:VG15 protein [Rhodococcus sp. SJ-2]